MSKRHQVQRPADTEYFSAGHLVISQPPILRAIAKHLAACARDVAALSCLTVRSRLLTLPFRECRVWWPRTSASPRWLTAADARHQQLIIRGTMRAGRRVGAETFAMHTPSGGILAEYTHTFLSVDHGLSGDSCRVGLRVFNGDGDKVYERVILS